jgi:glutaredoxin
MNQPKIEIFTADICGLCHKAKDFFRSRNLPFTAYDVEWDKAADAFVDSENTREMYRRCGKTVDFVPQIFINGRHHIAGWRKLEPMIASGEFEKLLQD